MPKKSLVQDNLIKLLQELETIDVALINDAKLAKLKKKFPKSDGNLFKKSEIVMGYRKLAGKNGLKEFDQNLVKKITKRPVRSQSGVTPITVLTKPFPCPGRCIFCPSDVRMPKSYLSQEPGAQRAERNWFDPYLQTYNRLLALHNMGHNVDKAEIIILGGTWSFYPESYQIWFIAECFRALNHFQQEDQRIKIKKTYQQISEKLEDKNELALTDEPKKNEVRVVNHEINGDKLKKTYNQMILELYVAPEKRLGLNQFQTASWKELFTQQKINETAKVRCVGLVVETRPDNISEAEVIRMRKLGATKVQIGVQSLQGKVLELNHRGHDVAATRRAFQLLRQAGFKIHAHWMANLYGSSVAADKKDYLKLFADPDFKPDELKVYPCSLIKSAELMNYFNDGRWQAYSYEELLEIITFALKNTPAYCRLTRIIRDISSGDIVTGNKKTNFRQIATDKLRQAGLQSNDIRAREIRNEKFKIQNIKLVEISYETSISSEIFLQFVTDEQKLLAFLRLSLPKEDSFISELKDSAMIREIHVYGPAQNIGYHANKAAQNNVQHSGLGTQLIRRAEKLAQKAGYKKLAVIASVGTREYYRKRGFTDGQLYQFSSLSISKRNLVS
jgi:elongator complex protein 3 (tRNA carboxymethyluridine synthase)